MGQAQQSLARDIERLFDAGTVGELSDRQLLERLEAGEGPGAELAFTAIVARHGPMVMHACRTILGDRHAAEDAFQATFLVLSRKRASLWVRDSLGPWLFGVASRVAWCARRAASRRRLHERRAGERVPSTVCDEVWDDRAIALYEELGRLPARYRLALVLCDLEGLTQEEAARKLGWPSGTVRSRLARGRCRLRDQLTKRGLAPAIVPLGAALARPTVPAVLAAQTVEYAMKIGAAGAVTSTLASAIALTEGVTSMMFLSKLKLAATIVLTGGFLVCSTALIGNRMMLRPQSVIPALENQVQPQVESDAAIRPGSEPISPMTLARLEVASKLRDNMYIRFSRGEIDVAAYLDAQHRLDEVIQVVAVKNSDADRVRYQEVRIRGLRKLEQIIKEQHLKTEAHDLLVVERDRLAVEHEMTQAKAKIAATCDIVKARLDVARKIRDAKQKQYEGGLSNAEPLLTWQKRCDDLAFDLMSMTGGDRVRHFQERVDETKRLEQLVGKLFRDGQVQETDLHIVQYYRLEVEEMLAAAKAEREPIAVNPGNGE